MKNVYLVQPNNALSKSLFLPYSVGTLAAYAFSRDNIKEQYALRDFIFTKEPIEKAVCALENPYVIGFSNYMWNIEYNLAFAAAVKIAYPSCIVLFGGPHVPDDTLLLEEHGFIDILMHGEGEITFYSLLTAFAENKDLQNIANISYRQNGTVIKTPTLCNTSLDDFPSPYTMGLFDNIIRDEKYSGIQFDTVIETNRGCPYGCVYCCWAGSKDRFRKFPIQKIKAELEWMAKNKIAFCICADANFGILDRDEEIAEYVIELKKEYGYPEKFETTAAKNKDELTFRINSKLENVGLNRGISLAVQSMSEEVLSIIGRTNMTFSSLSEQLALYRKNGMYTYTDLILGLPGETLESFCNGLFAVLEAGQHYAINVNRCEFLPNTKMYDKQFVEQYKIKTVRSYLCQNHSVIPEDMRFGSRSELVVETDTMRTDEWKTALRIATCVQSFHSMGLLRFFAIYLRKAKNIPYRTFYTNLYTRIENESQFIKKTLDTVFASMDGFLQGKENLQFTDARLGNLYWDFQEALFILCVMDIQSFYAEISNYLSEYFTDDAAVLSDLLIYQKELIALPAQKEKQIRTDYDWDAYFADIFDMSLVHPKKEDTILTVHCPSNETWSDYAREIVWYGKRTGKTINRATRFHS